MLLRAVSDVAMMAANSFLHSDSSCVVIESNLGNIRAISHSLTRSRWSAKSRPESPVTGRYLPYQLTIHIVQQQRREKMEGHAYIIQTV